MTSPNTGRTNAKFIQFLLDNSSGILTDLTAYTKNVGSFGLKFDEQEVTAYSDDELDESPELLLFEELESLALLLLLEDL